MKNRDLELAKVELVKKDFSLVIVKNEKIIFKTKKHGISGFLHAIEKLKTDLVGACVADKIVGEAAAMLCVYSGVSHVFALTISAKGIKVLQDKNIDFVFENKVLNILNRSKMEVCPFEKLASSGSPKEVYVRLRSFANQLG